MGDPWEIWDIDTQFYLESLKGRDHWEYLGVVDYNIKMDLREVGWEGVNWMHLVQDRDQWRAVVNTAMNFRAPK
jgi:hypothetical protein